jgi:hypothetical protein
VHVVFSTDCSPFQSWQSYLVFHSAHAVSQPGRITRIVSGCEPEEEAALASWHSDHRISPDHHIHFTPRFDQVDDTGKTYSFFNKPFGVLHWLENAVGLTAAGGISDEDVMVAIIDPDMVFLAPIANDFSSNAVVSKFVAARHQATGAAFPASCTHGNPFGQQYGLGNGWQKFDLLEITGDPNSPAMGMNAQDANAFYPVGPPYIATGRDMYAIVKDWAKVRSTNTHAHAHAHLILPLLAVRAPRERAVPAPAGRDVRVLHRRRAQPPPPPHAGQPHGVQHGRRRRGLGLC